MPLTNLLFLPVFLFSFIFNILAQAYYTLLGELIEQPWRQGPLGLTMNEEQLAIEIDSLTAEVNYKKPPHSYSSYHLDFECNGSDQLMIKNKNISINHLSPGTYIVSIHGGEDMQMLSNTRLIIQ